jgi:hypothetical protein
MTTKLREAVEESFRKKKSADRTSKTTARKVVSVFARADDAKLDHMVKRALKWRYEAPENFAGGERLGELLVRRVTPDPGMGYADGVKNMVEALKRWEKLGVRCQGEIISHRISLVVLARQHPGGMLKFAQDFNIPETRIKFHCVGARRMALLAVEASPGLWFCPAVIEAWDMLCRVISTRLCA